MGKNKNNIRKVTLSYVLRLFYFMSGIALGSFASMLMIRANIGLGPWAAFHIGISQKVGMSYGMVVLLVGVLILALTLSLKEPIGFGTILNILTSGPLTDLFMNIVPIPKMRIYWQGLLLMIFGLILSSFALYFYLKAGLGAGPRDSLMIALKKRMSVPIGGVRVITEGTALLIGWLLGAKVGLGTVLAVIWDGIILQSVFTMLHFDVRKVHEENIRETLSHFRVVSVSER